jgi:hypothetical protein
LAGALPANLRNVASRTAATIRGKPSARTGGRRGVIGASQSSIAAGTRSVTSAAVNSS